MSPDQLILFLAVSCVALICYSAVLFLRNQNLSIELKHEVDAACESRWKSDKESLDLKDELEKTKKLLRSESKLLEEALRKPESSPSQELSEFLEDFPKYGYSFVRVDPSNVFYRSPKKGD